LVIATGVLNRFSLARIFAIQIAGMTSKNTVEKRTGDSDEA